MHIVVKVQDGPKEFTVLVICTVINSGGSQQCLDLMAEPKLFYTTK